MEAIISIAGLAFIIILGSIRTDLNIGIFAFALAYLIGVFINGFSAHEVALLFPSEIFLMLLGISLLAYISVINGTLEKVSGALIHFSKGRPGLFPLLIFASTFILSAIGAGNIAATALVAPVFIILALRIKLNILLAIILICTGANAGSFSPVAPTGIINAGLIDSIGIDSGTVTLKIFLLTAIIQTITAAAAYFIFKGYKISSAAPQSVHDEYSGSAFNFKNHITIVSAAILFVSVIFFDVPVSMATFILASILFLFKAARVEEVLKEIPWGIILLVSGITMLIAIIDKSGGMFLIASFIAKHFSLNYINSLLAFLSGFISIYSSSSGVVIPAFINLIPELTKTFGGGNILSMIIAVDVGSHMVDVSPLSVLGALCLAAVPNSENKTLIFRRLLIWGFSMCAAAAILCYVMLDVLNW